MSLYVYFRLKKFPDYFDSLLRWLYWRVNRIIKVDTRFRVDDLKSHRNAEKEELVFEKSGKSMLENTELNRGLNDKLIDT